MIVRLFFLLGSGLLCVFIGNTQVLLAASSSVQADKSPAEQQNFQYDFLLADKYIKDGLFQKACDTLRSILHRNPTPEPEAKALIQLGRALLLSGRTELAETTFGYFRQKFPSHQKIAEIDFLTIESQLSGFTNLQSFEQQLLKLTEFQPFGLDLDFFDFFTGFTKGYVLSDYQPIYAKLQSYFQHSEDLLRERSLITDAIIRVLDFAESGTALETLEHLKKSPHREFAQIAQAISFIAACRHGLSDLDTLKQLLPESPAESRIAWLIHFLYLQIAAYLHGDFAAALTSGKVLLDGDNYGLAPQLEVHFEILNRIVSPAENDDFLIHLARELESYSSLYHAQQIYEKIIHTSRNPALIGLAHYRLGRIYQGDFSNAEYSEKHFRRASELPLPPEFQEEIAWRRIRNLPAIEKSRALQEVITSNGIFTEAAILQKLKQLNTEAVIPSMLEHYYQTLLTLDLDPVSQIEFLQKLSEGATAVHQYAKARYFLLRLAEFDIGLASRLLENNFLQEQVYLAANKGLLATEPEKFAYQKALYLLHLGRQEEGQAIFMEISQSLSIYAIKARFELFCLNLPIPPYNSEQYVEIEAVLQKEPDLDTQKKAAELLFKHHVAKIKNIVHQKANADKVAQDKKSRSGQNEKVNLAVAQEKELHQAYELMNTCLRKFPASKKEWQKQYLSMLIISQNLDEAIKLQSEIFPNQDSVDYLNSRLQIAELQNDAQLVKTILQKLLLIDIENQDRWLPKLFLAVTKPEDKEEAQVTKQKKVLAFTDFSHQYPLDFSRLFGRDLLHFAAQNADLPAIQQLVVAHQEKLGFYFGSELFNFLDLLDTKKISNPEFQQLKLQIMKRQENSFQEEFLFNLLQKPFALPLEENQDLLYQNALLSCSLLQKHYQKYPNNLNAPKRLHLNACLQKIFRALSPDFPNYQQAMELDWLLRDEASRQKRLNELDKFTETVQTFYLEKQIKDLLAAQDFRAASNKFSSLYRRFSSEQRIMLFIAAYESMFRTSQHRYLREWQQLMAREINDKNHPEYDYLTKISRHINGRTVIESLNREINWDHPQHPDNFDRLLKIAQLYENELEDMKGAADVYYQLSEFFPAQAAKITAQEERLLLLEKALSAAQKPDFELQVESGKLWLERLNNPQKALEVLTAAQKFCQNPQQEYFLIFQKIRCLIQLREIDHAVHLSKQLPAEYRFFSIALSKQINAVQSLAQLPAIEKANYQDLLEIARINLEEMQNLTTSEKVFRFLEPLAKKPHPIYKQGSLAKLYISFYNIAMGQNEAQKAVKYLQKVPQLTERTELSTQALYLLGNHYWSFVQNLNLAESCFKSAHNIDSRSVYGRLSLYSLVLLYEQDNKQNMALEVLKILRDGQKDINDTGFLGPHELQLRKNIVLSRLEDFQELQYSNPEFILKTARSLAWKEEFFVEAEKNYLLYYRIMEKNGISTELRREIADFYLRYEKLSAALKYLREIISYSSNVREQITAGLAALELVGLKMQNFTAAAEDIKQIKNLMPNHEENERLQVLEKQIKALKDEQKKLNLRTLNYSHLPAISQIKKDYYRSSRYEEAARELETLLGRTENFQLQIGIYYELARLYDLKLKNYKKAHDYYEKFFNNLDHPQISPEILLRMAELCYEEFKDHKKAREDYELYLRKYPAAQKKVAVLFKIAEIYSRHEMQFSKALDTYTDISNSYPQTTFDENAKFEKARLLAERMGDMNGAIQVYRDLVETNFDASTAADALFQIARIYETQLNNRPQAIIVYEELISRFPNSNQAITAKDQIEKIRRR